MRLATLTLVCAAGAYGAGLFSVVAHEAGHAVAVRMTGGRVLDLGIDACLRGRSHPLSYYPFVESVGYFDRYWVAFGGFIATVGLGTIGASLLLSGRRRLALPGAMLVGTTFGALAFGALRFAITGAPSEASDLFLFFHFLRVSLGAFRVLIGALGIATAAACACLVMAGLRRLERIHGVVSAERFPDPLEAASMLAAAGAALWFFGIDWTGSLIVCVLIVCGSALAGRSPLIRSGVGFRTSTIAVQAAGLLVLGALSLGTLRLLVPGDAHRPITRLRDTERDLRLAAYWATEHGDPVGALKYLEQARARFDSVGLRYDLGTRYRVAGRTDDAVRLLSRACETEPLLEPCWAQLAKAYEQAKSFNQAARAWKTAAELEQQDPDSSARDRRTRLMLQRAAALATMPPSS